MNRRFRRYEILLPVKLDDGRDVPSELRDRAVKEIVDTFGAASEESESVEGHWEYRGHVQQDSLSKIVVDVEDTAQNRQWMLDFKLRWKEKLDQVDIWLVSYRIEIE